MCNDLQAFQQERDHAIAQKTLQDDHAITQKTIQEALTGLRPDANNNEKDHIMKEDLEDVKRAVTEIKYMMFLVVGIVALRLFGFL